jgi:predicted dithiol-disulfide oxidoreductase (DUF899 family)
MLSPAGDRPSGPGLRRRLARADRADRDGPGADGLDFPWVSSGQGDFNYDFGVSFTPEDRAAGRALYNYGVTTIRSSPDMFGVSIFVKDDSGAIFHTYPRGP